MSTILAVFSVLATVLGVILGFVWVAEHVRPKWSRRKHAISALLATGILAALFYLPTRGRIILSNEDLLTLQAIAETAHEQGQHGITIRLTTWTLQFRPRDESIYRLRAGAAKQLGRYSDELSDRKIVIQLNPGLERNHLPILEDYILLTQYDNALNHINEYKDKVSDQDVRTMMSFFEALARILKGEEESGLLKAFSGVIAKHGLSQHFKTQFWKWDDLAKFLDTTALHPDTRAAAKELLGRIQA